MASTDNEIINVRERPLSSDINDLQALLGRTILDSMKEGYELRSYGSGMPSGTPRNCVLGGMEAVPNGNDISINPGALVQDSAALLPTPGSLDSSYRIGFNRAPVTVDLADPGSTTWYIVEGQMTEVTTVTSSRDVLDPGSGSFTPQMVPKQRERRILFQVVAGSGSNMPVPSGGDWVPICLVRRPGGGGPVAATDIVDARPFWNDRAWSEAFNPDLGQLFDARVLASSTADTPSNLVTVEAETVGGGGSRLFFEPSAAIDITAATYVETGVTVSANAWYYLYLVPWASAHLPVTGFYGSSIRNKGVLVLSATAPVTRRFSNAATIAMPAPFNYTAPIGSAFCVGALRRNSLNTGWTPSATGNGRSWTLAPITGHSVALPTGTGVNSITGDLNLSALLPAHAKRFRISVFFEIVSLSGTARCVFVDPRQVGGSAPYPNQILPLGGADAASGRAEFWWEAAYGTTLNLTLSLNGAVTANWTSSGSVKVTGWEV